MVYPNKPGSWAAKSTATILLGACAVVLAHAQSANSDAAVTEVPIGVTRVQAVEGITEYRLANGLKVLLAPDLADDRVTVNLTYMVGSRHEGYGEAGMAHLLEHLVFKGTPTTADPKAEFRKRGFTFNGTTTADRTNYFATFVSSQESLNWYLGWQADAMVHSFIAKKDLDSEMTVVRNEFDLRENNPLQALAQRMSQVAYLWHAYGKTTMGAKSDIENVDISKLQDFYKRHYRPDNAVLIVAGKFDVNKTLLSILQSLGSLVKPETPIPKTYTLEPPQDGERSVMVRRPAANQLVMVSYHTPAALHPDSVALNVLATALGDAPSGRLHKALVESRLAQTAVAVAGAQREGGAIVFGTLFGPEDEAGPRQKLLLEIVENLTKEPIRQDEFERAKTKLDKGLEMGFANAAAVADGAMTMEVAGDWRAVFVARERLKTVTLDDVNRVARTYLLPDNRTLGHLIPTQKPLRAPATLMPDVAAYLQGYALGEKGQASVAFDFSIPSLHDKVMFAATPGGVKTAILSKPVRGDLVQFIITLKFGTLDSLQNQNVAGSMANVMLLRGTPKMTRQQIQDELSKLGAKLSVNFGQTGGSLSLTAKMDTFKPALELAVQLLKESNFPENEFEEMRSAWIKNIEGRIKDSSAQANNAWLRYGNAYLKGDPRYSYTLEDWLLEVKTVTRDQVYQFYRRFYGAQNAQVRLLGPVDVKEYQQTIAAALDGWQAPEPWRRVERPLIDAPPARLVFNTGKNSVNLRAIHSVPVSEQGMEVDYFGLALGSRILGGGPGSRLWRRLRETEGLSYNPGAGFNVDSYERNSNVYLTTDVAAQNVSAAEKALQEELTRTLSDGFTAAEVETFKHQLLADRLRARSGDGWAMGFMRGQLEFGYPKDGREKNDALIGSLTDEQINAVWRKYVKPEKLVWGVFGDKSKIR
ncbi:MAG: pitrilysin family protein [Rhodoferax sp.]|uniref:M16 family metallopeptidase n=1 Tax=Rhodoferax sp. TaxID=50421 RepID=UPI00261CC7B2|nr:pitrilysin family protein [Rhodoferax sp.]MDD5334018.1 pitrilysin family protein [Rhodoferax sp.]